MTAPLDLDALERALAAMTPGPWRHSEGRAAAYGNATEEVGLTRVPRLVFGGAEDSDRAGIVALVNAAPALLAEVRALRARVQELEEERNDRID